MSDAKPDGAVLVEACCDSLASARAAVMAGAGRIELCGPGDGGTTPSHGLITMTRKTLPNLLAVMIRPRAGDFVYDADELSVMEFDIAAAGAYGADAVVLGVLTREGRIDRARMRALMERARPMEVTMHRAFDRTRDPLEAIDDLLELGVDRVLTSGHAATAREGAATLRALQERAGMSLTVMAGGTVRAANVGELLAASGVREVHARALEASVFGELVAAVRVAERMR